MKYTVSFSGISADQLAYIMVSATAILALHAVVIGHDRDHDQEQEKEPAPDTGPSVQGWENTAEADETPRSSRTLVDAIIELGSRSIGVTRAELKAYAVTNGFNVGSVSPTLVKLMNQKKIKRVGKGAYSIARRLKK